VCADDTIGISNAQQFGRTEENQYGTVDGDGAPVRGMKTDPVKRRQKNGTCKSHDGWATTTMKKKGGVSRRPVSRRDSNVPSSVISAVVNKYDNF